MMTCGLSVSDYTELPSDTTGTDVDYDRFSSRRSTVYALRGIVVTSQPLAAQAGISILKDGGNAFDATVAHSVLFE